MSRPAEFHLRLPKTLYTKIRRAAKKSGVSTNAWMVGVLEASVDSSKFLMRAIKKEDGTVYEFTVPEEWLKKQD